MSRIKETVPLQRGSITSISLFEHGKHGEPSKIEFKLAEIKDKSKKSKGFLYLYVDPSEKKFVHPDDVYRSNGLPRVKPENMKLFINYAHYTFKRFLGFMP